MHPLGNDLILGAQLQTGAPVVLSRSARSQHMHISGATGTGKSKGMEYLIRQDIANWRRSGSGMLVLDPHGSLYDGVISWLASSGVQRPVVPIDLRSADWIVAYNLLRRRDKASPAVVIDSIVNAFAHAWNAGDMDKTPLLARWLSNLLQTLYEKGATLVEAIHLIDSPDVRAAMTVDLKDKLTQRDWRLAASLSTKDFEQLLASTVNRLQRFLRSDMLRMIFGQADVSLDLRTALDEGWIILVCLAPEGANVSRENSDLFATLLLSDLWTAAQERGKRAGLKPFYLYIDEFQRYVTPAIAEGLDQARGFGIHATLANQHMGQLRHRGEIGELIHDSVMENASSKMVFRLTDEANLRPMAQWLFRGTMNPDEIKCQLYSTKVLAYREEMRTTITHGRSSSSGGGTSTSASSGGDCDGEDALWESSGSGDTESWTTGESESISQTPTLIPVLGKEALPPQFRSLDEQVFRAMAALFDQPDRQCVARLVGMRLPISLRTHTIQEGTHNPVRLRKYVESCYQKLPFALRQQEAIKRMIERENAFLHAMFGEAAASLEPVGGGRRIVRRAKMNE